MALLMKNIFFAVDNAGLFKLGCTCSVVRTVANVYVFCDEKRTGNNFTLPIIGGIRK